MSNWPVMPSVGPTPSSLQPASNSAPAFQLHNSAKSLRAGVKTRGLSLDCHRRLGLIPPAAALATTGSPCCFGQPPRGQGLQ